MQSSVSSRRVTVTLQTGQLGLYCKDCLIQDLCCRVRSYIVAFEFTNRQNVCLHKPATGSIIGDKLRSVS